MSQTSPHPVEVAAHHQLVEHVAKQVPESLDVTPVQSGLAAVRGWLDGEPISLDLLESARTEAQALGRSSFGPERSLSWLCTAVGNLCWMACGERGWEHAHRTTLDAAVSALTSRLPRDAPVSQRLAIRDQLAEYVEKAREAARRTVSLDLERAGPPAMEPIPDLTKRIGVMASDWLAKKGAEVDPRLRATRAETRALLEEKGLAACDAALDFDVRYGGIAGPQGPFIGVKATIVRKGFFTANGEGDAPLVPVGAQGDLIWFLDEEGRGWVLDIISDPAPVLAASSGDVLVARSLLFELLFQRRMVGDIADLNGHRGAEVAADLGLPPIAHATDEYGRCWGDAETLVAETRWPDQGDVTIVGGENAELYRE